MAKTTVDVDPELLEAAKARLGTSTIKDTINAALREIAERGAREEAIDALAGMVQDGTLEWQQLDDKRDYRPAPKQAERVDAEDARIEGFLHSETDPPRYRVFEFKSYTPSTMNSGHGSSPAHKLQGLTLGMEETWKNFNAALSSMRIPAAETLSLNPFLDPVGLAQIRKAQMRHVPLVDFQGIHEMREAIKRLLLQHTSLGPHPDTETRETLESVDDLLEDIEALADAAKKAASEAAE
ncbi:hypothetical protein [Streptomyces aureus]|uniref:hypothetical protein n=1 Tax=Streptomyces aureus TaxID=193461 RepID=UPI0033C1CA0D